MQNQATASLRFSHVTVTAQQKTLLHDVSFAVWPGDKVALCGKSGSGKSTVLKTLLGLYTITAGEVYVNERRLTAQSIAHIRQCIAYIAQEPILGTETVAEALLLPFQFKSQQQTRPTPAQLHAVLDTLQLPRSLLNSACRHISGGEKQRVALARGLLLGKRLYLLDEVTSALDQTSKQAVFAVFADPALTVLLVTHDPDWLSQCQRVFDMDAGQLNERTTHANS